MKTMRILLPFTSGVDMDVLEQAVLLAKGYNAILIPLALIQLPESRRSKGARLEHIQQAKDFLEAVRQKAARHGVSIEQHEVFTRNVVQSIGAMAQQVESDGIFLFVRGKKSMLLSDDEIECIIKMDVCTFYIVHLAAKEHKGFLKDFYKCYKRSPGRPQGIAPTMNALPRLLRVIVGAIPCGRPSHLQEHLFNWLPGHSRRQEREDALVPAPETSSIQCEQSGEVSLQRASADLEEPARH